MNTLPRLTQTDLHLTDEQFCNLLDRSETSHPHLDACAECQSELSFLRQSLSGLSTTLAALETPRLSVRETQRVPRSQFWRPMWAASLATAAVLLTISVSMFRPHHVVTIAPAAAPDVTVSDEALLDGIQSDLSTSIPPSLEPLAVPTSTSSH